jgi:hypothetical protein
VPGFLGVGKSRTQLGLQAVDVLLQIVDARAGGVQGVEGLVVHLVDLLAEPDEDLVGVPGLVVQVVLLPLEVFEDVLGLLQRVGPVRVELLRHLLDLLLQRRELLVPRPELGDQVLDVAEGLGCRLL